MGLFFGIARASEKIDPETGGEAGASGLPQLALDSFPSQIFWLVVTLVVLYMIFSRVALPAIGGTIEERHDAIEDDLDRATELNRKAKEVEQSYADALAAARAQAQEIAAKTRAEIQLVVDEATAKADAEISALTAESEARIGEIRVSALEAVAEVASDTAEAVIASILPAAADADAVKAAVAAKLKG